MFDIGWSELLVIGVVAIIVVGPKELPRLMRTFGHYMGKVRHMAADFQRQFEDAVRDSEIDEVRKAMHDVHAQASDLATAPVDKPLMTPLPKPSALASAAPAPETPPKTRTKRVSAKAKAKPISTESDGAKPASPKSRRRKVKEPKP